MSCLLCPRKRKSRDAGGTSAMCQEEKFMGKRPISAGPRSANWHPITSVHANAKLTFKLDRLLGGR